MNLDARSLSKAEAAARPMVHVDRTADDSLAKTLQPFERLADVPWERRPFRIEGASGIARDAAGHYLVRYAKGSLVRLSVVMAQARSSPLP